MNPEKRRAGRRIRKARRQMREVANAFNAMGRAAELATRALHDFAAALTQKGQAS